MDRNENYTVKNTVRCLETLFVGSLIEPLYKINMTFPLVILPNYS